MEAIMKRNLYQRSTIFKDEDTEERNIHIGLDLWIKAGTPILAALEGTLHSFNFNAGFGGLWSNYYTGAQRRKPNFYTLYGLSLDSLEDLTLGAVYKKANKSLH
jgi:hypothetical protein